MYNIKKSLAKINIDAPLYFDEPMAGHTSFKIGGPADLYVAPRTEIELARIYSLCKTDGIPAFLLGDGANILVSDRGIAGVVIAMERFRGRSRDGNLMMAQAGLSMSRVAEQAANSGLSGLEAFYAMPGSVGGSIWMNARCYGTSVSDVLEFTDILGDDGRRRRIDVVRSSFAYKKSPFQDMHAIILQGGFRLEPAPAEDLSVKMAEYRSDREKKGHFLYPCAGSTFKNNRRFGMPTGKLIDSLGMKGLSYCGAKISDTHANIIINTGDATADDVKQLVDIVKNKVEQAYGFVLEEEILYIGRWEDGQDG